MLSISTLFTTVTHRQIISNLIRRIFRQTTLPFKFSSREDEVSKVHLAGGGGGVVTSDRPTSLFPLCSLCSLYTTSLTHTRCLCPAHALSLLCVVSMSGRSLTSTARAGWPHTTTPYIETNHQPTSFALFPPACEPPVSSSLIALFLPILTRCRLLCVFVWLSQSQATKPQAQPQHRAQPEGYAG